MSKSAGGVRVTSPEQYGKNLESLVRRLETTRAKLVWASTTPMLNVNTFPSYRGNLFDAGSEIEYNRIAAAIMKRNRIPIVDMHAFVLSQFDRDEKHPGYEGYQKVLAGNVRGQKKGDSHKTPMHKPVVAAIQKMLR